MRPPTCLLLLSLMPLFGAAPVPPADAPKDAAPPAEKPAVEKSPDPGVKPVTRDATVEIAGRKVPYRVTAGKIQLKREDGKSRAAVFHMSYERTDVASTQPRPVVFAFNGGPGSSAVWLHLGMLGPRVVTFPMAGTAAPVPPARVSDNPLSILDVCDLVFIDPVSTGYSRPENDAKAGDFHGVHEDIESVGDFIRRWIGEHQRWSSPKYLLGESYGGLRAAGLAQHLQGRYGMSLNGVVLLSSLLDFATLREAPGNDLAYIVHLPSFAAIARHHGKVAGDPDTLARESNAFAFGEYASALLHGNALDEPARRSVAAKLERFTSIAASEWLARDLRIGPSFFRSELLRRDAKVLGRFDARTAWDATYPPAQAPDYDPSFELAYGAFSTAMMDYLGREIGYTEDQPYEILNGRVSPWRWNANNEVVNMSDVLAEALRDNPHLRVLVMCGDTDLATPAAGIAHSIRHLPRTAPAALQRVSFTRYHAGHMFYLNPPDLAQARKDLLQFIQTPN